MKHKLAKTIILTLILSSFLIVNFQGSVKGDWGRSSDDCSNYHGITQHCGRYIESPNITIDGIFSSDESWNHPDVYEYIIPMANHYESTMRYKSYMYIKYIYDETSLYILACWNDSTPINRQDQLFFCWNINCSNFTVSQFLESNAMKTTENGTRVDTWTWMKSSHANGTQMNMFDGCYGNDGWLDIEENKDPTASYISGTWINNIGHYQVEINRSLSTDEPDVDVQFEHDKIYRFSTSVADSIGSIEHAISWTYELDLTNSTDPDFIHSNSNNFLIIGIGIASGVIIFSIGIIFILIYKIKH